MNQSLSEQRAWLPPERLLPVPWIEKHIILPPEVSPNPGPYSFDRTPFWREIANSAADKSIRETVILKPTQVGYSQLIQAVLAWQIDQEPGPALFVLPKESVAREFMEERIKPLIRSCPLIASHLSRNADDFTKSYARFDSMALWAVSAESPSDLASRPIRYAFFDEIDKYPIFSGREAGPISLGTERTKNYKQRAKIFKGSTPTFRLNNIWRAFENADDQKCYLVPCPFCRHLQRFVFSQLKWPDNIEPNNRIRRASKILRDDLAYYECERCKDKILDRHKPKMLNNGSWVSGHLEADGQWAKDDTQKTSYTVGYWINTFYSPWVTFSQISAEFLKSVGDEGAMMNFRNSWMAEIHEEQIAQVRVSDIVSLKTETVKGVIPEWAQVVFATIDVQSEGGEPHFYYGVRAWGPGYKSQLVEFGRLHSIKEIHKLIDRTYQASNSDEPPYQIDALGIDGHFLKEIAYDFATLDARIKVLVGSKPMDAVAKTIVHGVGDQQRGIARYTFDSNYFKNQHEARKNNGKWHVNASITDEYLAQLASEHKIIDRKSGRHFWQPRSQGIKNHYLDVEIMQHVLADLCNVNLLVDEMAEGEEPQDLEQYISDNINYLEA